MNAPANDNATPKPTPKMRARYVKTVPADAADQPILPDTPGKEPHITNRTLYDFIHRGVHHMADFVDTVVDEVPRQDDRMTIISNVCVETIVGAILCDAPPGSHNEVLQFLAQALPQAYATLRAEIKAETAADKNAPDFKFHPDDDMIGAKEHWLDHIRVRD